MVNIYPERLKSGDEIRVIAPSLSMAILSQETIQYAISRFQEMGFKISFSKHTSEVDFLSSGSIESRVADLHEAFLDKNVKAIITAIGGYNCNQMLEYINWSIVQENPKIICGFSDITVLLNSIFTKTGLITYYGPHFSTFGQKLLDPFTVDYFIKALTQKNNFELKPANYWSEDKWYLDQDNRNLKENSGYWVIQPGYAKGELIGGHLGSFCLLQGTRYAPSLDGKILIIEEDAEPANPAEFDRRLESLLQQPGAKKLSGILIGRFEDSYGMNRELLEKIIKNKKILSSKPIIANVDFGHTEPHLSLPIGGDFEINAQANGVSLLFL